MRYIFTLTILMVVVLTGAFYYVCYTPALVQKCAPEFVAKYIKDLTLNSLQIGRQSITYPEILKLYKIKADVEWQNEVYQIEIAELDFLNFSTFLRTQQQAQLDVAGLNIQKKNFEIKNAVLSLSVALEHKALQSFDMMLRNGELFVAPYHLNSVQAHIQANKESFNIGDLKVLAYGGQAKGKIDIVRLPRSSETAVIEFSDVKSEELAGVYKNIFSQITGDFSGTIRWTRVEGSLQVMAIFMEILKGGRLGPRLSKRIVSYMIDEEKRDKITALVDEKHFLPFDNAEFRVLNLNQKLAGVTVTVANKSEDLLIHETINVDIADILKKFGLKK